MHILDLMAKIYDRLLYFFDSWYSNVFDYFSLAFKKLKPERNEAFSAGIILYFIRNNENYLTFLEFSQFRRRSILFCEAQYSFHIYWQVP